MHSLCGVLALGSVRAEWQYLMGLPGFSSATGGWTAALQAKVLAGVAAAVAVADPDRAEAIARSIEDALSQSSAPAHLVRLLAQPDSRIA